MMRVADSDSSDETATSTSDATESSAGGHTDKEINDGDVKEDRFRVDRRKLEQMLQGETMPSSGQTADNFFHKIMEETSTQISWPSKLKVGAKTKKDPHIKIIGDPENVSLAREKVLEILDTKRNKVTLKMDVSFTDHSHIIGKGGQSIQQVMEDTGCHIHFPDSNRNSVGEKSNQVSIAGLPAGVEKARCQIRELLPMVLTFEIPQSTGYLQPVPDASSPAIQLIQQRHGFTVTFRPKQRVITVVVRGSRKLFLQQRQGIFMLMDYLTGGSGTVLPVSLSMEVTPQHHAFVMGRGNSNVATINRETGATVTFPDPSQFPPSFTSSNPFNVSSPQQTNTAHPRRSTVVITGHMDGVCTAWQELMGCLPLVLMFDLKEGQELDTAQVTKLMDQLDVNIVIRPKPKQNTKCLLVRGAERDSRLLFEVRRQLLDLDPAEESLPVCCDKHTEGVSTTNIPTTVPTITSNGLSVPQQVDKEPATSTPGNPPFTQVNNYTNGFSSYQQLNSQLLQPQVPLPLTNNSDLSSLLGSQGNYPLIPWIMNQLQVPGYQNQLYAALLQARMSDLALTSMLKSFKDLSFGPSFSDQASSSSQASSLSSPNDSPCESPVFMNNSQGNGNSSTILSSSCGSTDSLLGEKDSLSSTKSWNNPFWLSSSDSSSSSSEVYSDYASMSTASCDSAQMTMSRPAAAPAPPVQTHPNVLATLQANTAFQTCKNQNRGRPIVAATTNCPTKDDITLSRTGVNNTAGSIGCERQSRDMSTALADYNLKKLQAAQAVQKPVISGARIPTDVWSGYGFSKTLPEDVLRNRLQESRVLSQRHVDTIPEDGWYGQTSTVQEPPAERKTGFAYSVDSAIPSFSSSNYFDNNLLPKDLTKDIKDLPHLLSLLGLDKYREVFQQQQVDLPTFVTLTDHDLQELSIPFFARRKMLKASSELKLQNENCLVRQPQFQPAPGAERRALFSRHQTAFGRSMGPDW